MSSRDVFDRLQALPPLAPDVEQAPPIELVAILVAIDRRTLGWKQSVLADFAGVSLTTVERLERGEPVSPDTIDKIAVALGHPAGYFTAPRRPLTAAEMAAGPLSAVAYLEIVDVAQPHTQAQLRELASCSAVVMLAPDLPEQDEQLLKDLAECMDYLGFVLAAHLILADGRKVGGRRAAYRAVSDQLEVLRAAGYCVVAGVTTRPARNGEERIALFGVSVRSKDPGGLSRRKMVVDRCVLASGQHKRLLD